MIFISIQFLKDNYDENLHSQDHHLKFIKDNEKFVVALKAIGNAGQIQLLPLVLNILTKWIDHNAIMTAAIDALGRMPLQGNDLEEVFEENFDSSNDLISLVAEKMLGSAGLL